MSRLPPRSPAPARASTAVLPAVEARRGRLWLLLVLLALAALLAVVVLPPYPQPLAYHRFADQRPFLGVPNFLDVVSNAPFLVVGSLGLLFLLGRRASPAHGAFIERAEAWPYAVFFLAVALTSFGSAYYHLAPDNPRLAWDRLPLTLGLTSLLAATIAERVGVKTGLRVLVPLLAAGAGGVMYWRWSELRGAENLHPYLAVHACTILAIVLVVALFPSRYSRGTDMFGAALLYAVAKVAELLDAEVYALGHVVSGHTVKHLVAALAVYWILRMLHERRPLVSS